MIEDEIWRETDKSILVEAAAGTGKTSALVKRMIALLASNSCGDVSKMVAVTFTRKAAAELRARFMPELENAARGEREYKNIVDSENRTRLSKSLDNANRCFMGTIHSFCAKLIRERPIEAGVPLDFEEIDELEDAKVREEAWKRFLESLRGMDSGGLAAELREYGLPLSSLKDSFFRFADFPDVAEWPLPDSSADNLAVPSGLDEYLKYFVGIGERLPLETGTCMYAARLKGLSRAIPMYELEDNLSLARLLSFFEGDPKPIKKVWNEAGIDVNEVLGKWRDFQQNVVIPYLDEFRKLAYIPAMRALLKAKEIYDLLRIENKVLNFQDLLLSAANMLRKNPSVRSYFSTRHTHLLVDEFQDTDPIQAQVLLFLASQDHAVSDWIKVKPRPGSLFVVGDPKQSIYRFRRADILTYLIVRGKIFERGVHEGNCIISELKENYRSSPEVISWA
ncbi:MAG: UvrD-helicase domain-containing protein, partial [Actinomycetota bacterium]|nr:UvrD-helicase domain-containing protein [Actinomycetota bacterium]